MSDISDLRWAIVPKSDQLNAEQLLAGPMTLEVTDVRIGSDDQPIIIHYTGDNGRPYKPCKTMRKLLVFAWGEDGRRWIGRAMTVYNDPNVRFGGQEVGGIRISHLTDIPRPVQVSLTATKGKKALHTIQPLNTGPGLFAVLSAIKEATNKATMEQAKRLASQLVIASDIEQAAEAYRTKVAELRNGAAPSAPLIERIQQCPDLAALQILSDEAETLPAGDERDRIMAALLERDRQIAGV